MSAPDSTWPTSPAGRPVPEALARTLRHEVGDFLQKVYASVALLENRLPPEWDLEREILARLQKRAESCRQLLDAFQDFLCPISANTEIFDLSELVARKIESLREEQPNLNVTLESDGPALVLADPGRIQQVAGILLTNALESSGDRVNVSVRPALAANRATWTISDNGPGISTETASRLFDPFFTTKTGHAGLGLAVARKLVALQKGEITGQNRPEGGFQIRIVLPGSAL